MPGTFSNERAYLPVFTYWMQSPWFLKVVPFARTSVIQPPSLHWSLLVGTLPPIQAPPGAGAMSQGGVAYGDERVVKCLATVAPEVLVLSAGVAAVSTSSLSTGR